MITIEDAQGVQRKILVDTLPDVDLAAVWAVETESVLRAGSWAREQRTEEVWWKVAGNLRRMRHVLEDLQKGLVQEP